MHNPHPHRHPDIPYGIALYVSEIMNDVTTTLHLMKSGDKEDVLPSSIEDIDDEDNTTTATKLLTNAFSEVVEILYPLTRDNVCCPECDTNDTEKHDELYIPLSLPHNFSEHSVHGMTEHAHQYIKASIIKGWLQAYGLKHDVWDQEIEDNKDKLSRIIAHRTRPFTRPQNPFGI